MISAVLLINDVMAVRTPLVIAEFWRPIVVSKSSRAEAHFLKKWYDLIYKIFENICAFFMIRETVKKFLIMIVY